MKFGLKFSGFPLYFDVTGFPISVSITLASIVAFFVLFGNFTISFVAMTFDILVLCVWEPPATLKTGQEKGQRLGVVTKKLGACLEFDSRDRSLTGRAGQN